ncbi:MAG: Crp/Fnr family transcriptional regulator [Terracidiphilus sp.]
MSSSDKSRAIGSADFLLNVSLGKKVVELQPGQVFFAQGDPADSVFYLTEGRAKLTVVSPYGKQATITLLAPGDFFGEESLASAPGPRLATATAVNRCAAIEIKRDEMFRAMHQEPAFCDRVLSFLVTRGRRTQADLVDQIFNSSEKRLARTLLMMAESGKPGEPRALIPPITQETLAEMIGTTRSRVNYFMNRFRNLGLIEYKGRIQVHKLRLQAALVDQFAEI